MPPSELVVATAPGQTLPEVLLQGDLNNIFTKFIVERQDTNKMQAFPWGLSANSVLTRIWHVYIDPPSMHAD
jgi:hypothetical protein